MSISPPKPKLKPKPQLPPRSSLYPPRPTDHTLKHPPPSSSHAPSSSISSFHSVSLSSDTDVSTPGSVNNLTAIFPVDLDRTPTRANSKKNRDADDISLTESYENVSTTSLASPATERMITLDWEKAMAKRKNVPPKLPERPRSTVTKSSDKSPPPPHHPIRRVASSSSPIIKPTLSTSSSSSSLAPVYTPRRLASPTIKPNLSPASSSSNALATIYTPRRAAPPPPPSRSSDRSSIVSTTTTHSVPSHQPRNLYSPSLLSLKIKRPTPVPPAARKRYEAVFNANIIQRRKAEKHKLQEKPALLSVTEARSRRAVGWRGLSVDLLTANDVPQQLDHGNGSVVDEAVGPDEKLEGPIIRHIWKRSRLDNSRLAEIWDGCDLTSQGALSLEAFVKGMWRIDEELRRMQAQAIKAASSSSLGSYRSNSHRSTTQKSRDILR